MDLSYLKDYEIKKIDVEDKLTVNEKGLLEDVTYINVWATTKKYLTYITLDISIDPNGKIENNGD